MRSVSGEGVSQTPCTSSADSSRTRRTSSRGASKGMRKTWLRQMGFSGSEKFDTCAWAMMRLGIVIFWSWKPVSTVARHEISKTWPIQIWPPLCTSIQSPSSKGLSI